MEKVKNLSTRQLKSNMEKAKSIYDLLNEEFENRKNKFKEKIVNEANELGIDIQEIMSLSTPIYQTSSEKSSGKKKYKSWNKAPGKPKNVIAKNAETGEVIGKFDSLTKLSEYTGASLNSLSVNALGKTKKTWCHKINRYITVEHATNNVIHKTRTKNEQKVQATYMENGVMVKRIFDNVSRCANELGFDKSNGYKSIHVGKNISGKKINNAKVFLEFIQ